MTLNEVTYIGLEFHVVWLRSSKGNSGFNISFNNLVSFFTDYSSLSSECFEMRKKCSENHWVRVDGSAVSRRASLSCREFGGVWSAPEFHQTRQMNVIHTVQPIQTLSLVFCRKDLVGLSYQVLTSVGTFQFEKK